MTNPVIHNGGGEDVGKLVEIFGDCKHPVVKLETRAEFFPHGAFLPTKVYAERICVACGEPELPRRKP